MPVRKLIKKQKRIVLCIAKNLVKNTNKIHKLSRLVSFTLFLIITSCSSSRFVKPLAEDENAFNLDLGGPVVNVPGVAKIPLPITSVTYGRGLSEHLTVYGSWYPTASIFGILQLDAGAVYQINKSKIHGITVGPNLNFAINFPELEPKLWPNLDLNYYWYKPFKKWEDKSFMVYGGIHNWFELSSTRAHDEPQTTRWIFSPHVGYQLSGKLWDYKLEYRLIAPNIDTDNFVVSYSSYFGTIGSNGWYISVCRRF